MSQPTGRLNRDRLLAALYLARIGAVHSTYVKQISPVTCQRHNAGAESLHRSHEQAVYPS